jgi:hypothetical protein
MATGAQDTGSSLGSFSPDSTFVAIANVIGGWSVQGIYDLQHRSRADITVPGKQQPEQIVFSPDSSRLMLRTNKGVFCFASTTGQPLASCGLVLAEHVASVLSGNGARLVTLLKNGSMVWRDTAQWKVLATLENAREKAIAGEPVELQTNDSGDLVLLTIGRTTSQFRLDGGRPVRADVAVSRPKAQIQLLGSGRFLISDSGEHFEVIDAQRIVSSFKLPLENFETMATSAANNSVAYLVENKIHIVGLFNGIAIHAPFRVRADDAEFVTFSRDGTFALRAVDGKAALFDFSKLSLRYFELPSGTPYLSPSGGKVVVLQENAALVHDVDSGVVTSLQLFMPLASIYAVGEALQGAFQLFSTDGKRIVLSHGEKDEYLASYDADTGRLLAKIRQSGSINTAQELNALARKLGAAEVHVAQGAPDIVSVISKAADRKLRLDFIDEKKRKAEIINLRSGQITRLEFGEEVERAVFAFADRVVIGSAGNGNFLLWDAGTGKLLIRVVSAGSDGHMAMTAEGFLLGSKGAMEQVSLVRGDDVTSVDQLFQTLFNPDLVREKLLGDLDGEVRKAASLQDLERVLSSGNPPRVTVLEAKGSADLGTVDVLVRDSGGGVGRIEWRVNGATVAIAAPPVAAHAEFAVSQAIALDPGDNTIEVVAYNKANLLASLPTKTAIKFTPPTVHAKPKLHVLAIGINSYSDQGWTPPGAFGPRRFGELKLAVKDATAIATALRKAPIGSYEAVNVTLALEADATVENLERIVQRLSGEVHARDTFILFAAGHGFSVNGRFYLIPHDYQGGTNPAALAKLAIGQDRLQDWIGNKIKARKAVILLDTCASGALVAGHMQTRIDTPASEAAIGRLHEATGRPILTAAASGKPALEGYKEHGIFTWALLNALRDGDANKNGFIELFELAGHVQNLVPKLSAELGGVGRTAIAVRGASGTMQSVRFGSLGEDYVLVRRLQDQ